MDRPAEHMRFGPTMLSCDRMGMTRIHERVVVVHGEVVKIQLCSGCQKEVISDVQTPGSYNPAKPHVAGSMFTVQPHIIYYPVTGKDNLVYAVDLNQRIAKSTRKTVLKSLAVRG